MPVILPRRATHIVVFLIASAAYSHCEASPCNVAIRLGVKNLAARVSDFGVYQPEIAGYEDRIERGFQELAALKQRCPLVKFAEGAEDCQYIADGVQKLQRLSQEYRGLLKQISGCELPPATTEMKAASISVQELILQTLSEQQKSDGEAVFWIANDLLALILIYPEDVIDVVLAHPSFRERFILNLGNRAFEDLDDTPGSKHKVLREKMLAFSQVLNGLPGKYRGRPECARLIAEMWTVCGCTRTGQPNRSTEKSWATRESR
jgi:hypothetical protein